MVKSKQVAPDHASDLVYQISRFAIYLANVADSDSLTHQFHLGLRVFVIFFSVSFSSVPATETPNQKGHHEQSDQKEEQEEQPMHPTIRVPLPVAICALHSELLASS